MFETLQQTAEGIGRFEIDARLSAMMNAATTGAMSTDSDSAPRIAMGRAAKPAANAATKPLARHRAIR